MNNKQKHKQTGVGEVPEGWKVVGFEECIRHEVSKVGKVKKEDYNAVGKYPIIDQSQRLIAGYTDDDSLIYGGNLPVIIFGDHTRVFKFVDFPFVCGADGTKVLLPDRKKFDPGCLFYFLLNTPIPSRGYNRHYSLLRTKNILRPPLNEQLKIASVLSTVDEAIQKTGEVIGKAEELKQGLMQSLLILGRVVRLEEIATQFISGGTPSTSNSEYWNGNIPWMKSAWIKRRFVDSGERYISKKGLRNSATNIVPQGNILIATRVCMGNVAINRIDIAISQDLTGVVIEKSKAYPEYVYWALRNSENRVKQLVQGSTIKGILREDLKRIKIPLPSLPEQRKIASIISTVDDKLEKERRIKSQFEYLKRGLMQVLLTGRVRVKVD